MLLYAIVSMLAIWKYNYYKHTALRFLLFYMLLQMVAEYIGMYLGKTYGANAWWYSVSYFFSFLYIYLIFRDGVQSRKFKKNISRGMFLYIVSYISLVLIFGFDAISNTSIYIFGASIAIGCIVLYYVDLLKTNNIVSMRTNLLFWVSVGLLLFYVGYLPIKSIYLVSKQLLALSAFKGIHYTLIIIMNLCFITGFLLVKPRTQP